MEITFVLNSKEVTDKVRPEETVLEYLHKKGLQGTREGCGEGDCGACSVSIGEKTIDSFRYRVVTSCLMSAVQLHGKHLITVEGLAENKKLHPVQKAIVDSHGTQCGFCTPGIVMTLFTLFNQESNPDDNRIKEYLTGNLCRCTGYDSIMHGAKIARENKAGHIAFENFGQIPALIERILEKNPFPKVTLSGGNGTAYSFPKNFDDLFSLNPLNTKSILTGGSDLFVNIKKRDFEPEHIVDITGIPELTEVKIEENGITIGSAVLLSDIEDNDELMLNLPPLAEALPLMASRQVKSLASLGGNLGNASPIADTIPPLWVMGARVILLSENSKREVDLSDFFIDYKKTQIAENEIIGGYFIPAFNGAVSDDEVFFSFEKISKRTHLDIASANSALSISLDEKGLIKKAVYVIGGCAAVPIAANKTCDFLFGKKIDFKTVKQAGKIAAKEVSPMDDVRGSAEYRRLLAERMLIKHFVKIFPQDMAADINGNNTFDLII
jgi:xanthine dehydrogenase small subunit